MPGKDSDAQLYQSLGPGYSAKTQMPRFINLQDLGTQQRLRCPVLSILRTWVPSKDSDAQIYQSSGPGCPAKLQDAQIYQSSGPGCPAKTQMPSFINL